MPVVQVAAHLRSPLATDRAMQSCDAHSACFEGKSRRSGQFCRPWVTGPCVRAALAPA